MDFGGLPPEINSARMYAGPGSGPMLAAASAWDGLATELQSTASSYGAVISELTGESWVGPSSAAMEAAATPYVAWLNAAAGGAEETAAQAGGGGAPISRRSQRWCRCLRSRPTAPNWRRSQLLTFLAKTLPRLQRPRLSTAKCGPRTPLRCTAMPRTRRQPPRM